MKKQIAFFDFDGTITTKDTLLEFIKFTKGKVAFYRGFFLNLHYLLGYKIGIISNQYAKEQILTYFFKDTTFSAFENQCVQFAQQALPALIRPQATDEIRKLISDGATVVVVTASSENWIKPWTDAMGVQLIGTRLALHEQKITGKIIDVNCHGEEKVARIKQRFSLTDYNEIYAYGDTSGDKPMLRLAHKSYYKPFR